MINRPNCHNCGKKEAGLVVMFGQPYCGNCFMEMQKEKQNKFEKEMKRVNKK